MPDTRIALIGAGTIGRTHLRAAAQTEGVSIVGIADPNPAAKTLADEFGIPWHAEHHALLAAARHDGAPGGAIIATPNALHVPLALDCIAAGVPVLVEKPIADTVADAQRLSDAAAAAGIPLLVGHHRRHNPIIRRARELVHSGALGRLVAASVLSLFLKPDTYFAIPWRRAPGGGGPVLINMIHEIDLIRFVCGEIASVQAATSNAVRGHAVEDTAATVLHLDGGAIVTITLSDTAASPWSWDQTAGESLSLFQTGVDSHFIAGTQASLTLPSLTLWRHPHARSWEHPIEHETVEIERANPYAMQLRHFAAVISGKVAPITPGPDGIRTLAATLAVTRAAELGTPQVLTAPAAA
jgi:predicted dehydrogenase